MSQRLDRLRNAVGEAGVDAIVLNPGPTLRYLTDHDFTSHERLFLLLLPARGDAVAVVPALEENNWRDAVPTVGRVFPWDDADGPEAAAAQAFGTLDGARKIAIEPLAMRYMEYSHLMRHLPQAEVIPADPIVDALRLCKEASEAEAIRAASGIATAALEHTLETVKVGSTEREIAGLLSSQLLARGGEGISFGPIVLGGPKSALPHGVPDDRALGAGEYLLIDFGTSYRGYHCDITRTFVVGAEPDDQTRRVYEAVRLANERGVAACRPGTTLHDVHHACQDHLHEPEWSGYFKHRTGHGLGVDIHEPPSVMDGNHDRVEKGMVFTIEPGLYLHGWGGVRIEDDVWITEDGCESLTELPRDLRVIGRSS